MQAILRSRPNPLPPRFGRSFLAALLRSAIRAGEVTPEEITAAVDKEREHWVGLREQDEERHREQLADLRARIRAFEEASGVRLGTPTAAVDGVVGQRWYGDHDPAAVGAAVRAVLNGEAEMERYQQRMLRIAETAERLAEEARKEAGAVGERT